MKAVVKLRHVEHTDTILLGHSFASFDVKGGGDTVASGRVVASGDTLRVSIDGIDGYVDVSISPIVSKAVRLLTRE